MLNRDQWLILVQGAAALSLILAGLFAQDSLRTIFALPDDTAGDRIAFAAKWLVLPAFMLLVGIQGVALGRFFSEAVNGSRAPTSHKLEINLRYNLNTLEQAFLASIAWLGLAGALPHTQLVVIPFFAVLFVVGRICFWVGYIVNPVARGFGLVLTFAPTMGTYIWLLLRFLPT